MPYLGVFGSYLVLLVSSVLCAGAVFSLDYAAFLRAQFLKVPPLSTLWSAIKELCRAWRFRRNERRGGQSAAVESSAKHANEPDVGHDDAELPSLLGMRTVVPPAKVAKKTSKALSTAQASQRIEPEPVRPEPTSVQPMSSDKATEITIIAEAAVEKSLGSIPERRGDYVFPPLELLSEAPDYSQLEPEDHAATMQALVQTLEEFSVKVLPGEIHTGPVITRYEVKPAPGVRVEKIVNLDKNIALGLRAFSVRILAPVPGKGTVGIEVPNRMAQAVCMRDIIESKAWADAGADIPVVLGKDVTGKPIVADLTKMPHVLIAGSTGAGKTVCINAIIASFLYHSGPEDLRFIMVDPKVVEMQMYNSLPHMLIPVVTEAKKVRVHLNG